MLESIIPAEADITKTGNDADATFKIKVTPRAGKLPPSGKLYFKLTEAYAGKEDISFIGTVSPTGENNTFVPKPEGMPYVAGSRGDGIARVEAVAELTSSGATLEVGIFGYGGFGENGTDVTKDSMVKFMQSISVEYAWVDEAT